MCFLSDVNYSPLGNRLLSRDNCQKEVIVSITIVIKIVLAVKLGQIERVIPQAK